MDANIPMLGFIGRLDYQKGVDLIRDNYEWLMSGGWLVRSTTYARLVAHMAGLLCMQSTTSAGACCVVLLLPLWAVCRFLHALRGWSCFSHPCAPSYLMCSHHGSLALQKTCSWCCWAAGVTIWRQPSGVWVSVVLDFVWSLQGGEVAPLPACYQRQLPLPVALPSPVCSLHPAKVLAHQSPFLALNP